MSELIEDRKLRLGHLVSVLNNGSKDWVPMEAVFNNLMAVAASCYTASAWDLFRADLDLLEDHDCLTVRDDYIFVTRSLASRGRD